MGFISEFFNKRKGLKEYANLLNNFVSAGKLTTYEKLKLNDVKDQYQLSKDDLFSIQKSAFILAFKFMASDKRIDDNEKAALKDIAEFFGYRPEDLGLDQKTFTRYRVMAEIDTGILPQVMIPENLNISLRKEEVLHWFEHAALVKRKRRTTKVRYGGVSTSIRIMKGVNYRVGSYSVESDTKEFFDQEDIGWLWLSGSHFGFKGAKKHFKISYEKVSSLELSDGLLHIFKEGRETPYIIFMHDYDITCSIISHIINGEKRNGSGVA